MIDQEYLDKCEAVRLECATNLRKYTEFTWEIIEPKVPFMGNWHIDAICDHLEAVSRGEILELIISMPPRHMKSIAVSVMWPSWTWLRRPESRWIFGSYGKSLSVRDSMKCRKIITSTLYQDVFKPDWKLSDEQNQKLRFDNTATGYRIATSVGGTGTGEGGDFTVVDDAMKATDAESETKRQKVIDWWDGEMSTRGNDIKTAAKVIIMQRLHANDLAGHCIKQGTYEVLRLPAEFDAKPMVTCIGWQDPRTEKGELLWPDRFDKTHLEKLKKKLGGRGTAAQLQQDPKASEDGLFNRTWWKRYKELPAIGQRIRIVQFWDTAQKPGISNDYSVCSTWAQYSSGFYLVDLWRKKVAYPQLKQAVRDQFNKHKPNAVVIEDKASGISLIQDLRQENTHEGNIKIPVLAYDPGQNDKQIRASAATPTVEAGNCFLPESAPWVEDFISEHESFPDGDNDDQVDTTSTMVEHFSKIKTYQPRVRRV